MNQNQITAMVSELRRIANDRQNKIQKRLPSENEAVVESFKKQTFKGERLLGLNLDGIEDCDWKVLDLVKKLPEFKVVYDAAKNERAAEHNRIKPALDKMQKEIERIVLHCKLNSKADGEKLVAEFRKFCEKVK